MGKILEISELFFIVTWGDSKALGEEFAEVPHMPISDLLGNLFEREALMKQLLSNLQATPLNHL